MQTHLKHRALNFRFSTVNLFFFFIYQCSTQKVKTSFGDCAKALVKWSLKDVTTGGFVTSDKN